MVLLLASLVIAAAIAWGCLAIAAELKAARQEGHRHRTLELLKVFAPAPAAAAADPRAVLVWEPLARAARELFPESFAELDKASRDRFPLGAERIDEAHAQWTAEWLAWEGAHDAEYKAKAADISIASAAGGATPDVARARLDLIEREKLEVYQRRYQEYVRVAKALQALGESGRMKSR